ncbi:hypothetical protein TraAM80_09250 [Trypanosoma rangeli]|uniref:C2HC/C3H-type domain-containing protein n=1 Tax=Trypanosoma rangeli TaxID=5698 RepID=A0A422MWH7_TRYRA|nr:uncharacterized protein TraAM80_09250 [Trypanosoma rangeli]RNE97585.1 hypothetical protein TraAM80_09250 [Trypanosoma rangeli]|eukprot:RNE97585.1 hypothetical protein TraAM80_09250 [Trypanosoma rangeli]
MPTATDFVQDYAAKRAAQMERAKRIREDRRKFQQEPQQQQSSQQQQQQQQRSLSHATNSSNNKMDDSLVVTPSVLATAARSRRIANVVEEDFKRATKAGIITPDQARQLWAMLSDQLVQVDSPGPSALTSSSYNAHITAPTTQKAQTRATANFGNSISLDSLRASIAQFKEKQKQKQKQKQQQWQDAVERQDLVGRAGSGGGGGGGGITNEAYEVATRMFAPPPSGVLAGTAGAAMSRSTRRELHTGSNEPAALQMELAEGPAGDDDMGIPGLRQSSVARNLRRDKQLSQPTKPAWNFDVEVGHNEEEEAVAGAIPPMKHPLSRQKRGTEAVNAGGGAQQRINPPMQFDEMHVGGVASSKAIEASQRPQVPQSQLGVAKVPMNKMKVNNAPAQSSSRGTTSLDDVVVGAGGVKSLGDTAGSQSSENQHLLPCGLCGRSFRASILARHEAACAKVQKKRRTFDMKEQRLEGIEGIREAPAANINASLRGGKRQPAGAAVANSNPGKLPKWKIQHEQFQAAMRAMRQVNAEAGGNGNNFGGSKQRNPLPPPPQPLPEEYDDRVPCPHCGRKFAELTAQRHIPKCMTTIAKPKGLRPTRR